MSPGWRRRRDTDDVPWSEPMHWVPGADIVPWREGESLHWRMGALAREVERLNREWDRVCRDGDRRLMAGAGDPESRAHADRLAAASDARRLVADGFPGVRTTAGGLATASAFDRLGDSMSVAARIQQCLVQLLEEQVPDGFLDRVPSEVWDAVADGVTAVVHLPDGNRMEARYRSDQLEVRVLDQPWNPWPTPASDDLVTPDLTAWFEHLMESLLEPVRPEPTANSFLDVVRDVFRRAGSPRSEPEGAVPGIQSQTWRDLVWRPQSAREDAAAHEVWNATQWAPLPEFDTGSAVLHPYGSFPRQTLLEHLSTDSGETTRDLLNRHASSELWWQQMIPSGDVTAMAEQLRSTYEDTTGLRTPEPPFLPDGTYVGPGQDTQGGQLEYTSRVSRARLVPLDDDGQPTGEPIPLTGITPVSWLQGGYEVLPEEDDVRGGHM